MADVNGTWLGTYWQQETATRFEIALIQSGKTLSGSILDDGYLGEARLQGELVGRSITFIKRYLTTSQAPITYIGTVSEDEDYMQGEWNIGRWDFGAWEARRSGENLVVDLEKSRIALIS
ncbi:hypothetical protein NIES4071_15540 [Calothrix sp. NIES-4071]|nr:hypothetical protein NIES4071_15540 [Calothrix sp. NIES-4071]BAZ55891.1 hypothetical protein NIES4105_15490 [Calothrix sp. NIES-4105]